MSAERGFVAIPNHIIRDRTLPGAARLLYGVMLSYAWGSNPCTVSRADLCGEAGIGKTAFFEAIKALEDRSLLRVEKVRSAAGWTNRYWPRTVPVNVEGGPDIEPEGSSESGHGLTATRTGVVRHTVTEEDEVNKTNSPLRAHEALRTVTPLDEHLRRVDAAAREEHGRFASRWVAQMERDRVADFLKGEPEAVQAGMCRWLADQCRMGWQRGSISTAVASSVQIERDKAERASTPSPHLFGRPLSAGQQRAAWGAEYASRAASARARESAIDAEVIE